MGRHIEDARVYLHSLERDMLVNLGGIVSCGTVAEAPSSMGIVTWDGWGLEMRSQLRVVDVLSRGIDASSVGGGNTPGYLDLTWLSLLGGVDICSLTRRIHSWHLPGLGNHRWCRWLLCCLISLLSLLKHAEGVTLGRSLLVCFSIGLREWVVPFDL